MFNDRESSVHTSLYALQQRVCTTAAGACSPHQGEYRTSHTPRPLYPLLHHTTTSSSSFFYKCLTFMCSCNAKHILEACFTLSLAGALLARALSTMQAFFKVKSAESGLTARRI
ncbi:hypothetical protein E2C01_008417 [Portunus trituberculatus]|uniref:Uncharacterized protein n=1 Tax=Portunus trituberculatus TaxID=210409 RepID=A0A5B7D2B5_PORTR|nr:hypothetical protein [Portunus trituberculatus]